MPEEYCICDLKSHYYEPVSNGLMLLEFIALIIISTLAVVINHRFRERLQEEKRARPLGRKGNIVEPIMNWFFGLQIIGTPVYLLLHWVYANEIIPFEMIPNWFCQVIRGVEVGFTLCIVYNSLFLAAIRYVYIVHHGKAEYWNFEKVGQRFKIASFAIPLGLQFTQPFTTTFEIYYNANNQFKTCVDSFQGMNSTLGSQIPKPILVQFTLNYIPETCLFVVGYIYTVVTVLVGINAIDAFLYYKIFKHIKR